MIQTEHGMTIVAVFLLFSSLLESTIQSDKPTDFRLRVACAHRMAQFRGLWCRIKFRVKPETLIGLDTKAKNMPDSLFPRTRLHFALMA